MNALQRASNNVIFAAYFFLFLFWFFAGCLSDTAAGWRNRIKLLRGRFPEIEPGVFATDRIGTITGWWHGNELDPEHELETCLLRLQGRFGWFFGSHLTTNNRDKPDRAGSEIATLFGILLVNTVTLAVVEQNTKLSRNVLIGLYAFISVIVLGAISCLLRSSVQFKREGEDLPLMHSYDRGTIMFGRWILGSSAILVPGVIVSSFLNLFVGQSKLEQPPDAFTTQVRAKFKKLEPAEFNSSLNPEKKLFGIKGIVRIGPDNFQAKRNPNEMDLVLTLTGGDLANNWVVYDLRQFRVREKEGRKLIDENGPSEVEAGAKAVPDAYESRWSLHRLRPNEEYELEVLFVTRKDGGRSASEKMAKSAMKSGFTEKCQVMFLLPPKK